MSRLTILTLFILASVPAAADWVLNPDASTLKFVTTKANTAAEVHTFGKLEGRVDDDGSATVTIDLDSVDTSIEIRDQRMREMLFETERYPTATIVATIDPAAIDALDAGDREELVTEAQLQVHGTSASLTLDLAVIRLSDARLVVSSRTPVIVNASQTGLAAGVEKLREVAGLPSISPAVPVTFDLTFDKH